MLHTTLILIVVSLSVIGCGAGRQAGHEMPYPAGKKPSADDSLALGSSVPLEVLPELTYEKIPRYPTTAREAGIEGYVDVSVYIDTAGNVTKAQVKKCSHPGWGFEQAALDAAYGCRYTPARVKSKEIECWIVYRVNFVLK